MAVRKSKATVASRRQGISSKVAEMVKGLEGLREAIAEGVPLEERFTVHTYTLDIRPRDYGPGDVRRVRDLLGMSQAVFAKFLGVSAGTVRSWEQGTRTTSGMARRFLEEIERDPEHWKARLVRRAGGTR